MEKINFEEKADNDQQRLVAMLKALGNPVRFRIMEFLAAQQTCITGEIVSATPKAQSTISQHLKVLRESGLIEGSIEGPAVCYCIDQENIRWFRENINSWLTELEKSAC